MYSLQIHLMKWKSRPSSYRRSDVRVENGVGYGSVFLSLHPKKWPNWTNSFKQLKEQETTYIGADEQQDKT